jgi:hypothetical protein
MVAILVKDAGIKSRKKTWRSRGPQFPVRVGIAFARPEDEASYSDRLWNDEPRHISIVLTKTANYAHKVPDHRRIWYQELGGGSFGCQIHELHSCKTPNEGD